MKRNNQRAILAVLVFMTSTGGLREASAMQKKTETTTTTTTTKTAPPPAPPAATHPPGPGTGPAPKTGPGGGGASTTLTTPAPKALPTRPIGPYHPGAGEITKDGPGGRKVYVDPKFNRTVTTDARGEIRRIEAPHGFVGKKIIIDRNPRGGREVVIGGVGDRVVSYGDRRGFVERPLREGYVSRTYVSGGRSYARVYRRYDYRGIAYYSYVPGVYYAPAFYRWLAGPWGAGVAYGWGGMANPWFGFYAAYFTPYPTYASAGSWLTDYLLAENLKTAYQNQQRAGSAPVPTPAAYAAGSSITPDTKAMIAEEVLQQVAIEQVASLQPANANWGPAAEAIPPALTAKFFIVSANLDVTAGGQACALTPGDVIQRKASTVATDGAVAVEVVSSKPGDCAANSLTGVEFAGLQEMQNQLRESVDSGLQMLAGGQVRGVIPPAAGARTAAEGVAQPGADAISLLAAQEVEASRQEIQVVQND
jgi:hypothetical protein